MSKQSEAEAAQNYQEKAPQRQCSTCLHFAKDTVERTAPYSKPWTEDKNCRCTAGGFAVKKTAVCDAYSRIV